MYLVFMVAISCNLIIPGTGAFSETGVVKHRMKSKQWIRSVLVFENERKEYHVFL